MELPSSLQGERSQAPAASVDFLSVPLQARGSFDPNDPFRRPAPLTGGAAGAGGPRPNSRTIIERAPGGSSAAALRGALLEEGQPGRVHGVRVGRTSLGRSADCDIHLDDGAVSQQHGFLFVRDEGATFIDTSTNGSLVDGARIHGGQVEVGHGTLLELGGIALLLLLAPDR